MRKIFTAFLLVMVTATVIGQVPMFFNTNTATGGNAIPFNSGATLTWRRAQWFIAAGSLGTVTAGNQITAVYFHFSNTQTRVYPNFAVRLKTGTGTGLTGVAAGPFEAGMTTVFSATNYTLTSSAGNWYQILLPTPFLYNPAAPLYVEIEHDATSGTGPTVYQGANITGPGNGRQWGDISPANITSVGSNQVNFGIDVIPAVPCNAAPASNTQVPLSFTTCVGIPNPTITLATTYTFGGITYQWQSSTLSPVGPFAAVPGATNSAAPIPTIGVTTWYQVVATCTNPGGGSTTLTPSEFYVAGSTTHTAPYTEDFEGIMMNNRLPNCSWSSSSTGTAVTTNITANTNNRIPNSGSKFGSFVNIPGTHYVYTDGIWMEPGITYSGSLWYTTDLTGANNWSNLSLLIGTTPSTTGLVPITTVNGAVISPIYKSMSNTFSVNTPGYYYVAIRATAASGGAPYLSFDDLAITIPCSVNTPSVALSANNTTICQGSSVLLTASGADTYSWSSGGTGTTKTETPLSSTQFYVSGTRTLTGCGNTAVININVKPSPNVTAMAFPPEVCKGSAVSLMASGASNYAWTTGGVGPVVSATPNAQTSYTVAGTATNNCTKSSVVTVNVLNLPTVTAVSSRNAICDGESVQLTAIGASKYQWVVSTAEVLSGAVVNVKPAPGTSYTVTGTDSKGCSNNFIVNVVVDACTGVAAKQEDKVLVYPNPTSGMLTIEGGSGSVKSVEVIDLTGRTVLSGPLTNGRLNMQSLANGVYYVKVTTDSSVRLIKVIRE
jgi:hypothetical protein